MIASDAIICIEFNIYRPLVKVIVKLWPCLQIVLYYYSTANSKNVLYNVDTIFTFFIVEFCCKYDVIIILIFKYFNKCIKLFIAALKKSRNTEFIF